MNTCPYYGFHRSDEARALVAQNGNQCAMITTSYSPCLMERDGAAPDWETCPHFNTITAAPVLQTLHAYTVHRWAAAPIPFPT